MSKLLRFKNLLGGLAILVALSMSWGSVQGQNLSSEKEMLTFSVAGVDGVIVHPTTTTAGTIDVTVPFATDITDLVATFTSSQFTNVFVGNNPETGTLAESGVSPSVDYSDPVVWTVEAENHSYENYTVTVELDDPNDGNDILTFTAAYWKDIQGDCADPDPLLVDTDDVLVVMDETDITIYVMFAADLTEITCRATVSDFADVSPDITTAGGAIIDFSGGPVDFDVTAQNGDVQTYTATVVVGDPSVEDFLDNFEVADANSVVIDETNQTIAVEVPYSVDVTTLEPTWDISDFAIMMDDDPTAAGVVEICSGETEVATMQSWDAGTMTAHYWIQAEDNSEVSEWVVTFENAEASEENELLSLELEYSKDLCENCGDTETDAPAISIVGSTVTVVLPFGVTEASIEDIEVSELASYSTSDSPLIDGSTITVTAENGDDNVYTVEFDNADASNGKTLSMFKFKETVNEASADVNVEWDQDYIGVIDQDDKTILVEVQYDTDLHDLIAYFESSDYSCVYIAESTSVTGDPSTYTPQCADETVNDHSNTLTYVVVAEDGTEERYEVIVLKKEPLTGNDLTWFSLTNLEMCIGEPTSLNWELDEDNPTTEIVLSIRNNTDATALDYSFEVSEGATAQDASGATFAMTGTADFSDPVEITVTAENGDSQTFTITVDVRDTDLNSVAKINDYWFAAANNSEIASDVVGTINETAKTVHLWVPWGTVVTDLVASFELENEPFVRMTRSEDLTDPDENTVCESGVGPETNFTTPVAYTVFAEDCSTVEYFVTVFVTPNTDTGISAFEFLYTGCECGFINADGDLESKLVNEIDPFAKRIHITLPYETDISDLAPYMITIHPEASIKTADGKAWNTKQDWTNGPIEYVVTAPDGVSKATWSVLVENPPCDETDILSFALPEIQVSSSDLNSEYKEEVVSIDYENHMINVIIKSGSNLDKVYYERTLSCGAEICCVTGNCVDNHYLDFSNDLCHTCVVTAQDESITQEWTICLEVIDTECPEVMTESVLAMNCEDSVGVTTNELGEVFILHEDAIACMDTYYACNCSPMNPLGDPDMIDDFIDEKMAARVTADTTGAPVYIPTDGLYSGVYYAFSIDMWGNVSCQSKQKLFLDICEKEVATLADLKAADPVYMYTVTGEVVVTYEETRSGGNLKYVQDETAGIEINDLNAGCAITYGVGTGLTGLKGMIMDSNHMRYGNSACEEEDGCSTVFVPICCYSPTVSSEGNVVAPILLTFEEFTAAPRAYDAMFVRITTPLMLENDYTGNPAFQFIEDKVNSDLFAWTANGNYDWIIPQVLNTNYIGENIPDEPKIYQGINTYYIYGGECYGGVTPRWVAVEEGDDSDILEVGDCKLYADPTPVKISGVIPETCSSLTDVDIINTGANEVTITALYLDDLSGQDEFELIYPTPVPFDLDHWGSGNTYMETVQVQFCPKDPGAEEATLVVEYCDGTILEVPIMGTTVSIFDTPYCTTFNDDDAGSTTGWVSTNMIYGSQGYNFTVDGECYYYGWSWVTPNSARPIILESPGFMIEDLQNPVVTWWTGTYFSSNLRVDVSDDYKQTWTTVKDLGNFTNGNATGMWFSADLKAFEGTTGPIFIRWYSTSANYFSIDNVCIDQKITTPVYADNVDAINMGGVQLGSSAEATYTITNVGVSALRINSVALTGDAVFTLTDDHTYPFEIHDGNYAYTVDPSGDALSVTVTYTPVEVGVQTAMLTIHYGMYEDNVVTIPIQGEGLSCTTAAEAVLGENLAPSMNSWYTFTAPDFMILEVTSCDPRNTTDPYVYSYDTYLSVWADCEGTLLAENDDLEWDACPANRALSGVTMPMNAGETIKIFWDGRFMNDTEHGLDPFYFHLNPSYPVDGDVCETAIPLTLPVVNHFGSTVEFEDDYDMSPCSPYSNYMDGNDKVYSISLATDGYLTGNILGAYGSIHVLDKCPKEELEKNNCKAFVGGPNGGEFTKRIAAGDYYVIISTWAPPQTVDYLLNMSFEEGSGIDDNSLTSSLSVYPNPTDGKFTVSISNAEATDLTVELVNISGQVVYRNEVKAVYTYNEDIDASSFAKGVYYLKVNDGTEVKVEKVVVQ